MAVSADNQNIYDAIHTWKEQCVQNDGSILSDSTVWTKENFVELDRLFIQNPDESDDSFMTKLERQMVQGTAEAKMLMAELLWLLFLFPTSSSMAGQTKRRLIGQAWGWSGMPFPSDHPMLTNLLDHGIGSVGTAFNTHRWREITFLIVVFRAWKGMDGDQLNEILEKPWLCAEWLDGVKDTGHRQMRHILLYFLFPKTFERTSNQRSKIRIIKGLAKQNEYKTIPVNTHTKIDVDRTIFSFREALSETFGEEMDFYASEIRKLWEESKAPRKDQPLPKGDYDSWYKSKFGNKQIWMIAAGTGGGLWDNFLDNNLVSIGWNDLGDQSEYQTQEEILTTLQEDRDDDSRPTMNAKGIYQFVHDIQIGDIIIVKKGRRQILGYGEVVSDYQYDSTRAGHHNYRQVKWIKTGTWDLPRERRIVLKTLTEFTPYKDWLYWLFQLIDGELASDDILTGSAYTREDALEDLFMDSELFDDVLEILQTKKNIILQGPPGVGKTYVSQRIAYALMEEKDQNRVNLIQFHQSYSYEDFIQGWRPSGEGFVLKDGVFYNFCNAAADDPDRPYVFIIDEINRGNLSRIFGEVMMLLEADKRSEDYAVRLTYAETGSKPFHIPPNVHVIGMMNTADRSLAMVDYALRRRFAFFDLKPAFDSEKFYDFLSLTDASEKLVNLIIERLTDINKAIREDSALLGPGFEIGHSYFCPGDEDIPDRTWYNAIIRTEIVPLLREYWFDKPDQVESWEHRLKA